MATSYISNLFVNLFANIICFCFILVLISPVVILIDAFDWLVYPITSIICEQVVGGVEYRVSIGDVTYIFDYRLLPLPLIVLLIMIKLNIFKYQTRPSPDEEEPILPFYLYNSQEYVLSSEIIEEGLRQRRASSTTLEASEIINIIVSRQIKKIRRFKINYNNLTSVKINNINKPDYLCSICLNDFKSGEVACKLDCDHHFHKLCISKWFDTNSTCPICRLDISEI